MKAEAELAKIKIKRTEGISSVRGYPELITRKGKIWEREKVTDEKSGLPERGEVGTLGNWGVETVHLPRDTVERKCLYKFPRGDFGGGTLGELKREMKNREEK